MEKKCLIIMPVSDQPGYAPGHVDRVYQYIIMPACRAAGFKPVRADDPSANAIPLDIIKNILECEIVICDVSTKNAHALYGFAIRQAINLPVALMKDMRTQIMFNIQEFSHVEYDESLRVDTVQKEITALSDVLIKAFDNRVVTNALLSRLDIGSAPSTEAQNIPAETEMTTDAPEPRKEESHLPVISPVPGYVGDAFTQQEDIDALKVGDFIFHKNYGRGEIKAINKMAKDKVAKIQFDSGAKQLILGTYGVFRKIIA
jgi:hypothetical protein